MKTIPILFAHCGLDWITGSERCLLDLVQNLDRERFRPVVVCNAPSLAFAAGELGATVYCARRFGDEHVRFLPNRALIREARQIVREEDIRLIHANDFQPIAWLLPIARSNRIPIVLHVHLPTTREERYFTWSHQVSRVVAVSRAALQGFLDDGLPPARATVIYNAVDPARLSAGDPARLRAELNLRETDVVMTAVGSLIWRKGFDILVRAFAEVRAAAPEGSPRARLLFVGDGPQRQDFESLATALGVADDVHFLGRRTDVPTILTASDIALSAAREEGLPLNVLEAGFFGLPTILSDIPPHREIIEHGRTGLIVPAENVSAFADAMGRLLEDSASRHSLGSAAREHIHSNFLVHRYAAEFSKLYAELLDASSGKYGWFGEWVWPRAYHEWIGRAAHRRLSTLLERGWLPPAPRGRRTLMSAEPRVRTRVTTN